MTRRTRTQPYCQREGCGAHRRNRTTGEHVFARLAPDEGVPRAVVFMYEGVDGKRDCRLLHLRANGRKRKLPKNPPEWLQPAADDGRQFIAGGVR